jgi:NAD+ kinase
LSGDYIKEKRMMMRVEIKKDNKLRSCCHALNDVVVSKSAGERLIGMELYTDGQLVNRYIADGLIIATPTGSTGYSISAGGPVVDPRMQLYVATPICAHMLSVRSAVLPSEKTIVIKLDNTYPECDAIVSADGDVQGYIKDCDEVVITKSEYEFELIKIGKQSFYDTVLKKLS